MRLLFVFVAIAFGRGLRDGSGREGSGRHVACGFTTNAQGES